MFTETPAILTEKQFAVVVQKVLPNSPAMAAGFLPKDSILAINGNTQFEDLFDYQFEVMGETQVVFTLDRNGQQQEIVLNKGEDDDPGLVFASPVFTPIKTCNNACPFCFIDQQPEGLRKTLYVKDDDWRLSYFCNTYITLTNLTQRDRERISQLRPGPLYVSVHATVPEVREKLLLNPKAKEILKELNWLASLEIPFHAQLVICPEINDGEVLAQSLKDLQALRPYCESIAVVPLGLTQHRSHLPELKPHTAQSAQAVLAVLESFWGESEDLKNFAFASDEFYVLAKRSLPQYQSYGEFPQLDDGVGNSRLLSESFFERLPNLPKQVSPHRSFLIITGELGKMTLDPIAQKLNNVVEGLFMDVQAIQNNFWGEEITVAGLITATDIEATLSGQDLSGYKAILIPATMVREEPLENDYLFLDGLRVSELSQKLKTPVWVVEQPDRVDNLLNLILA